MLGILIFSWIVSVLLVLLAERNNGYSSSLSHDEKIKRIREKRRRVEQEIAAMTAKRKEEHRIWMELMGFAKEEKKKLIKTNYNIVFFRSYINNILIIKRFEMNELRAKIKSLAERNRLATTDEERATVAAEMNTLRSENEQAFTEALEALIKTTADAVQELHGRHIKNN